MQRSLNMGDTSLRFPGQLMGGGVAAPGLICGGDDNTVHTVFNGTDAVALDAAALTGRG